MILIFLGIFLAAGQMAAEAGGAARIGQGLVLVGIGLFSTVVLFQLVNLPVEFNASSRARAVLVDLGIVRSDEMPLVRKVLSAAAMTYVAATLVPMERG
jgi:uncharacterized protein